MPAATTTREADAASAIRFGRLPAGSTLRLLAMNADERGVFTEIYRDSWLAGPRPVQWNCCSSEPNVMRGVRVHFGHDDYLCVLAGRAAVGLKDLRPGSPTEGEAALVEISGSALATLVVPAGVAHGLYFHEKSLFAIGVSAYHDGDDERTCLWHDPDLGIPWPFTAPRVSPHDAKGMTLRELRALVPPYAG